MGNVIQFPTPKRNAWAEITMGDGTRKTTLIANGYEAAASKAMRTKYGAANVVIRDRYGRPI